MKKIIKITWAAKCGRSFGNKVGAQAHETKCTCWRNPDFKTCLTCKFSKVFKETDGDGFFKQTTYWRECQNPKMKPEFFNQAHEKAPDVCINCKRWQKDIRKTKRKAVSKTRKAA